MVAALAARALRAPRLLAAVAPRRAAFSTASLLRKEHGDEDAYNKVPGFRAKDQIATNWEIATGAERYEYLKKLSKEEPWEDLVPVVLTKPGTKEDPIVFKGVDPERYVGCTGFPAGSHEVVWLTVRPHRRGNDRCPHCGNHFRYELEADAHHH